MSFVEVARSWKTRLKHSLIERASRGRKAARAYFGLLNASFVREQMAVAAGQTRYRRDMELDLPSYPQLRRDIHRLEKGLVMRPRRPIFGLDYLENTLTLFERAIRSQQAPWNSETMWAHDVLIAYFDAVDHTHQRIAAAHDRFVRITTAPPPERTKPFAPYHRDLKRPVSVNITAFEELTRRRRSVRWYVDKPVPRDLIDRAVEAAGQSPSACNRQSFVFRIFDEPEKAREIAKMAMGTAGFADNLPALAVVVGRLRAYPHERDRHAIYVDGALAAMSFMFAIETMSLASCAINWPDVEARDRRIQKALDLEPDERVIMLIAFGWPDPAGKVPYSSKRDLSQLRVFN